MAVVRGEGQKREDNALVYVCECQNHRFAVDTERIAGLFRQRGRMHVCPTSLEERAKLVERLEADGFMLDGEWRRNREDAIGSKFPITVNFKDMSFRLIGNTTCAAAAASSRVIATENEFYALYRGDGLARTSGDA